MITLSYWQLAGFAYAVSTLTFWVLESKTLFSEASGLDHAWQRLAYPFLLIAWMPVMLIGVPIKQAIMRRKYAAERKKRHPTPPEPQDFDSE